MKKLYIIVILVFGLQTVQYAQDWAVYDALDTPDSDSTAFIVSNNMGLPPDQKLLSNPDQPGDSVLQFLSDGAASSFMWRHVIDTNGQGDLTILARLKGTSDTLDRTIEFNFDCAGLQESLVINNNGTWQFLYSNESGALKMNPLGWHTYRIVREDSNLVWYLDENPDPVSSVLITSPAPMPTNNFFSWGDGSMAATTGVLVDWIIWDTSGAYAPGEGSPVPGDLLAETESSDATLSNLVSNTGTFNPPFSSDITDYLLSVPDGTESLTLLATPNDPGASAGGDGLIAMIPDTVIITVTAEDGYSIDYKVVIDFEAEVVDLTLAVLSADIGTLTPDFDPDIHNYIIGVHDTVESIFVTAVANDTSAMVTGAGIFNNIPGIDTITVSKDTLSLHYIINVMIFSSDASLISLTSDVGELNPVFNPDITEYDLEIPVTTPSVFLIGTPNDPSATVTGDGIITGFPVTVNITVTAEDNITTKEYIVNIGFVPNAVTVNKNGSYTLFPNPASQHVTFETDADVSAVRIYSSQGKLIRVIRMDTSPLEIDVSNFKAGVYLVRVYHGKDYEELRLVVK